MAYLGNQPVVGDSTNTFKLLDNIASFTLTFDATDTDVVSIANDTLSFTNHRFVNGQKVTYTDGGGTAIGGLSDGTSYFIIKVDQNTIKLATSASNAASSTAINLTSGAAGTSHTLNVAFDGFNTKFKATHSNGTKSNVSRAAQISLSVNGVIQQPSEGSSPTLGYSIEPDSTIVFSSAPQNGDNVFGSFIGEAAPSFDITDNTVNNFTGDGSTTSFTLSKEIPSSQDVLITLDGVTQYPTDASTTRAYSVTGQTLTFTSAPADGVAIQARLIGFAGATTSEVTGFYGRTGNAALINTDDISVQNISGVGATFTANVNIGGVLTYEDVTNVDSVGLITARSGISVSGGDIKVGSATTLSQDNIFTTGIVTATTFSGAVSGTTGTFSSGLDITGNVDITDSIRHKNDTDTVIRFPSDDNIQFDTAGVERVEIKASEVVFNDTGADTDFRVEGDGNENLFKVDAGTDRIGIGLASPQHMVHIQHATTPRLVVEDTTNNVQAQIGADNTEARIGTVSDHPISLRVNDSEKLRINTTGELGINVTPSNGEMLAITGRSGYDDIVQVTAVGDNMGARINLTSTGSGVGRLNAKNSDLALQTSGISRLYIKSDGNIGIGDDSPTVSLSIKSTTPTIRLTDSDASGTPESEIRGGGGDLILSADRDNEKASTLIAFQTDGTERLQITSDKVMFSVDAKVAADATYDLGASGARWNDLYIANNIDIKDNGRLLLGDSDDLQIYHTGSINLIYASNGYLQSRASAHYLNNTDSSHNFIRCENVSSNDLVSLHFNGVKKFETALGGIIAHGTDHKFGGVANSSVYPLNTSETSLGKSSRRWTQLFADTATIDTSDRNEKNNIIESDLGLDFINKLKPVSYKLNNEKEDNSKTHYGLIAQDVEETITSFGKKLEDFAAIHKEKNDPMGLRYSELISPLIKAIQELSAENVALKARLDAAGL